MWWMMSDINIKVRDEDSTTIRIKKAVRMRLQSMKRGNPERYKGVDTYDDVLLRLLENAKKKKG